MMSKVHKTFVGLGMEVMCECNFWFIDLFFILVYANRNMSVDLNCLFSLGHRLTEWAGLHWKEPFHWGSGITVDLLPCVGKCCALPGLIQH